VITTPDGEKVIKNQDGTTTPVVTQPDGSLMVKQKDGTLTPISAISAAVGGMPAGMPMGNGAISPGGASYMGYGGFGG
jgi:hypothetical protein